MIGLQMDEVYRRTTVRGNSTITAREARGKQCTCDQAGQEEPPGIQYMVHGNERKEHEQADLADRHGHQN